MLRAFFLPRGRRPRLEYWRAAALVLLLTQLVMVVATIGVAFLAARTHLPATTAAYVALGVLVVGFWAGLTVAIQRLHDQNLAGWWALIALVPVLGTLWYLFWNGLRPGTPGPNSYGPDPRGGSPAAVFGDGPGLPSQRKPPIASTIVMWLILLAILALNTFFLFQNPDRRAGGAGSPPALHGPIERR